MPMAARHPHEPHRVASSLELLFDLVFVVAIARAAAGLHHAVIEQHVAAGLMGFVMVFFAIWWAWMNFTWFASAYDTDDGAYRVAVFVQMTGALILAAGIPEMFELHEPTTMVVAGYVVMRLAGVAQWLRAGISDPARRVTAFRYAAGIIVMQILWCALLWVPHPGPQYFFALAAGEMAVPTLAEKAGRTTSHPHHIAERYALMTIIVLGESILSATVAVQESLASELRMASLAPVIVGGLLTVFSMWWVYFDRPAHDLLTSMRRTFLWGYGHFVLFASAAAVGAGLAAAVDQASARGHIGVVGAGYAVAIPVSLFVLSLWALHNRPEYRSTAWVTPLTAVLILIAPLSGQGVLLTGILLVASIALKGFIGGVHPRVEGGSHPTGASGHSAAGAAGGA